MLVLHRDRTQHIVKIVCRHNLADAKDEFSIEKLLPPPKLVQLRTVERQRAGQRVVALHAAGLGVRGVTVELQKLDTEATAFPAHEFFRIKASSYNEQTIKTPLARIGATGKKIIRVTSPYSAEINSRVPRQP